MSVKTLHPLAKIFTFYCLYPFALSAQQVHELLAGLCLVECAGEVARGGYGVLLLHSAHLHAHVFRLNHHHYAERLECFLYAVLYLQRHAFLHLQAVAVYVYHAGNLA